MILKNIRNFYIKYCSFYLLCVIAHVVLISIITFFHFLLDHRLIVVENWIYDFSWTLFLISKSVCFYLYYKFFIYTMSRTSLLDLLKREVNFKSSENYILPLISLGFICFYANPNMRENTDFDLGRSLFHGGCVLFTMFIDLIMLKLMMKEFSRNTLRFTEVLIFSLINYLAFQGTFLFTSLSFHVLIINFLFFYFYFYKKSMGLSLSFIFLFVIPLYLFLGFDPVWNGDFSLFSTSLNNINVHIVSLALSIMLYFNWGFLKRRVS